MEKLRQIMLLVPDAFKEVEAELRSEKDPANIKRLFAIAEALYSLYKI